MENKDQRKPLEEIEPVSRKTNEEIDSDEDGNLLIDGKKVEVNKSVPSDGPFSEDIPKGDNKLAN